jgi:amidase/6-aminohexanoate-cyclic-dimer hydrolase
MWAGFVADHDSDLVARYRRAGLVVVGKTNTPELGLSPSTEPVVFGPTRNPWNLGHSPGGSSGGAAAAVAAGILPLAHATDGGGSIRIPASCCGLFGLKVTRARNPAGPDVGEGWSGMGVGHAVTRSVRDSAALLDATHGPAPGDPYHAPPPARPFLQEVGADPGRLRIALATDASGGVPIHEECRAAAEAAGKLCQSLGHDVEIADPGIEHEPMWQAFEIIIAGNVAVAVAARARARGPAPDKNELEPATWRFLEAGWTLSAEDYARAVFILHRTGRQMARFMADYDVILTPTLAHLPPPLGQMTMAVEDVEAYAAMLRSYIPYTPIANVTGQPAVSLPLHWSQDGLPVGVMFAGRFGDEATLLRLSSQIEAAQPWADKRPALKTA